MQSMERHAATDTWAFPRDRATPAGVQRVSLRELAARPGRFEHHLMVVGRIGDAQLELVTASEPLFFAHANISDEYALALPTGDGLLDAFPFRTFLMTDDNTLAGRIRHTTGQLVLHPHGWLHWPGMLRPPYVPPAFPGARRCGLSLVFCATTPTVPGERPLAIGAGLEANAKAYAGKPPFHLVDVMAEPEDQWLGQIGDARMDLLVAPTRVKGPAYFAVLDAAEDSDWFSGDLAYVEGDVATTGVKRALLFSGASVEPPPATWSEVPVPRMPPFEDGERAPLPVVIDGLRVEDAGEDRVRVSIGDHHAEVPRYWLARMLFRLALHDFALGYLETYEGFFYDDRGGYRLGLRGGGHVALDRAGIESAVATLYRAVAPAAYTERLP